LAQAIGISGLGERTAQQFFQVSFQPVMFTRAVWRLARAKRCRNSARAELWRGGRERGDAGDSRQGEVAEAVATRPARGRRLPSPLAGGPSSLLVNALAAPASALSATSAPKPGEGTASLPARTIALFLSFSQRLRVSAVN
jgi:hypothetical protein